MRPGDKINSPQQLVDDHVDGIAEEGDPSLSGSVASGRVGTAGGRVSVGTVHCLAVFFETAEAKSTAKVGKQSEWAAWFWSRPPQNIYSTIRARLASLKNWKARVTPKQDERDS